MRLTGHSLLQALVCPRVHSRMLPAWALPLIFFPSAMVASSAYGAQMGCWRTSGERDPSVIVSTSDTADFIDPPYKEDLGNCEGPQNQAVALWGPSGTCQSVDNPQIYKDCITFGYCSAR